MQKWSSFSLGLMAGIIAVLLTVIVMQDREPLAFGQGTGSPVQGTGPGQEAIIVATGSSEPNKNDLLWVLYRHPMNEKLKPKPDPSKPAAESILKSESLTLACYQAVQNGRALKLVAVRDIAYDMDLIELANEKPHVRDIMEELRRAMPKKD